MSESLSDKERILTHIILELKSVEIHRKEGIPWSSEAFRKCDFEGIGYHPHCARWKKPEKGDLVICETSGTHHGTVGIIKELISYDEVLIQGVGDTQCVRVWNDRFVPILGIDLKRDVFLCGDEWKFYLKVKKAFKRGSEYMYRYNGIEINGNKAIISIRLSFDEKKFNVELFWNKKTTIKQILLIMRNEGYGSKYTKPIKAVEQCLNE